VDVDEVGRVIAPDLGEVLTSGPYRSNSERAAIGRSFPVQQIVSPFLISLGVLAGVVCTGWVLSGWLHDRFPTPGGEPDREDAD
jgi:hypothetical protein